MEILYSYQNKKNVKRQSNNTGVTNRFYKKKNPLYDDEIENIIQTFNEISKYWISNDFKFKNLFIKNSLGFIIPWLKRKNTIKILNLNFVNYKQLDDPSIYENPQNSLFARPQGTALHWLAGNVPVISLISLFQGLLSKNKNIIKVSKTFKNLFSIIFNDLENNLKIRKNLKKTFQNILNSILIVYLDHEDNKSMEYLSINSDIRVIWGGSVAVKKISGLKKKINCKDIIFGPKVSLAYISKKKLKLKKI